MLLHTWFECIYFNLVYKSLLSAFFLFIKISMSVEFNLYHRRILKQLLFINQIVIFYTSYTNKLCSHIKQFLILVYCNNILVRGIIFVHNYSFLQVASLQESVKVSISKVYLWSMGKNNKGFIRLTVELQFY